LDRSPSSITAITARTLGVGENDALFGDIGEEIKMATPPFDRIQT
jgi:hypothetical protein